MARRAIKNNLLLLHVDPLVVVLCFHTGPVIILAKVNMILSLDDPGVELAQLCIRLFGHVVQRLYLV